MSNYRRAHWIERNGHSREEVGHVHLIFGTTLIDVILIELLI